MTFMNLTLFHCFASVSQKNLEREKRCQSHFKNRQNVAGYLINKVLVLIAAIEAEKGTFDFVNPRFTYLQYRKNSPNT